jgi:uncharacterized membrane-anchored protein
MQHYLSDGTHYSNLLMALSMVLVSIWTLTTSQFISILTIIVLLMTAINQGLSIYKTRKELKKMKENK